MKVRLKEGCTTYNGKFYKAGDIFEVKKGVIDGPLGKVLEEVGKEPVEKISKPETIPQDEEKIEAGSKLDDDMTD